LLSLVALFFASGVPDQQPGDDAPSEDLTEARTGPPN
jgi:hypothetical protein